MTQTGKWLQAGPANRCLRASMFWAALAGMSLLLALATRDLAWWGRLWGILAAVGLAFLAVIHLVSYRVHRSLGD